MTTATDAASEPWTTRRLLAWMRERFEATGLEPARVVAEMLLAHVLGTERLRLYMEADRPASTDELERLRALVVRASRGEPVQLLVGTASFYGRDVLVDGSTQIPQPCTEALVAHAVHHLRPRKASVFERFGIPERLPDAEGAPAPSEAAEPEPDAAPAPPARIADVGTGSGCIAISVLLALPEARAWMTDLVPEALALAARNVERFRVGDRAVLLEGDGLAPLRAAAREAPFDVLVSNPPYVPDAEYDGGLVEPAVRDHVAATALRGGPDGLDVLRPLVAGAPEVLGPGGLLALECAGTHAAALADLVAATGAFDDVRIHDDEDGRPRTVTAVRRG